MLLNLDAITQAVPHLRAGRVIAYPTEAVYGLGCDPCNLAAVEKLLRLKTRPASKGLILIAATFDQLSPFILPLDETLQQRVMPTWPGFATWLLPVNSTISPLVHGEHETIAVRVSDHPFVRQLCLAFGGAIVSTSANRMGSPPAYNAQAVRNEFGERVDYVCEGEVGGHSKPSVIRDARTGGIVRS